jgi:membrane protease YdiL (CAAX protease family)
VEGRVVKTLVVYVATSARIFASSWLGYIGVAGVNLIPATVSLVLLVPLYLWYRNHRQRTALSAQIREQGKQAILLAVLLLFAVALLIRIPSVLLLNMAYEKTPVIFLVVLTMVLVEGTKLSVFGFQTRKFDRALLLGLIYYSIYEVSFSAVGGVLVYASTGQSAIGGYDPTPFVLTMPFMTFCVGISEEGLFRGYMQTHLNQVYSGRKANLIQAALFGLWHFVWHVRPLDAPGMLFHILYTFLIGLLFGYFYNKSHSLIPLILAHGLIDSVTQGVILNEGALGLLQTSPLVTQLAIQLIPVAVSITATFAVTRLLISKVLGNTQSDENL